MRCNPGKRQSLAGAIRPLDVAAILCVISVFGFVTVIAAGRFKEGAARTHCRANLLQIGTALQLYAKDNHDLLPDCSPSNPHFAGPQWPWDTHTNVVNELAKRNVARENLYCPANPGMNDDRHWNFWKTDANPARVIGYGMLLKGYGQVPPNLRRTRLNATNSQAELAVDVTASSDDDYLTIHDAWTDRSSHVRGKRPLGGNILFDDQHVAWRDFSEMQMRFSTYCPNGIVQWSF
jgi:hypothetical protein